jgi:hypothetical protein
MAPLLDPFDSRRFEHKLGCWIDLELTPIFEPSGRQKWYLFGGELFSVSVAVS